MKKLIKKMSILKSNLHFEIMTIHYKFCDFFIDRNKIIKEIEIKYGFCVLDFGCGPGRYITFLSKMVGDKGKVYALDIHPLAIKKVKKLILKKGLKNVKPLLLDDKAELQNNSIDVIILFDVLHEIENLEKVLKDFYSILKVNGVLYVSDHHLKEKEIFSKIINSGFFKFFGKSKKTYNFLKEIREKKNKNVLRCLKEL